MPDTDDAVGAPMLAILFPIGVLLLLVSLGLFTLLAWLKALLHLCEGQFINSGLWLCFGIMLLNFEFGEGERWHACSGAPVPIAIVS